MKPQTVYRKDYSVPAFWIDRVDLHFDLGEGETRVRAALEIRRNETLAGEELPPLELDGEDLELCGILLDGAELSPGEFYVNGGKLVVPGVPARFRLETVVRIAPQENLALSGLYKTSGTFCTQCEAMGFRRITYFLDRPDVMARFTTTIEAEKARYPALLSNGNKLLAEDLEGGRHRVVWEDPFPKPCYLFALVAGDLSCHAGSFTTCSGREVRLEIWVEPQNIDRCQHALESLQQSMKWDEEQFGREYDLDIYMIVAVNDFNMGAMENKGLNVFNSKYVLARPDTATDDDYEGIEAVIAHEYFHNWTGNRVTCRDWFQLTLKEGLTVFRDEQFTADMTSVAVKRIDDVRILRLVQFPEDAGPMAHPIRPESYISMDNFYTSTVYNKGAEVIRMIHTLLGADGFRRGMDLYFERHDGQAVTCDDFRAAMADATGTDLDLFERWYLQAGTPTLEASGKYDAINGTYELILRQSLQETPAGTPRDTLHIPVAFGLLGSDGADLPLRLEGAAEARGTGTQVLELKELEATYRFVGLELPEGSTPVPSLLRNFSAPVKLEMERSAEELAFLMAHDSDAFNRWDAGQEYAQRILLAQIGEAAAGRPLALDSLFADAWGKVLADPSLDGALKAQALSLPAERQLAQELAVVDVDAIHTAREFLRRSLAEVFQRELREAFDANVEEGPYRKSKGSIQRRRLKNTVLGLLAAKDRSEVRDLLIAQYRGSDNMTDTQAALSLLVNFEGPEREEALEDFYEKWRQDPLVLDKWFSVQAMTCLPNALDKVCALYEHPDFTLKNPNRLRSLVGAFCTGNQVRFHGADGGGYRFLSEVVREVDPMNPQLAARLVSAFNQWRRFDEGRKRLMKAELEGIAAQPVLSKDVREILGRALRES